MHNEVIRCEILKSFVYFRIDRLDRALTTLENIQHTLAPEIKFTGYDQSGKVLSYNISDDISGIESYNGYLGGQWALFSYDAKSGNLKYEFDPERMEEGKEYDIKIEVIDFKGNEASYIDKISF